MQNLESPTASSRDLLRPEPEHSGISNLLAEANHWVREHKLEIGIAGAASIIGAGAALQSVFRESLPGLAERETGAVLEASQPKFVVHDPAIPGGRIGLNYPVPEAELTRAGSSRVLPELSLSEDSGIKPEAGANSMLQHFQVPDNSELDGRIVAKAAAPPRTETVHPMPWVHDPDFFKPNPSKGPVLDFLIEGFARAGVAMR